MSKAAFNQCDLGAWGRAYEEIDGQKNWEFQAGREHASTFLRTIKMFNALSSWPALTWHLWFFHILKPCWDLFIHFYKVEGNTRFPVGTLFQICLIETLVCAHNPTANHRLRHDTWGSWFSLHSWSSWYKIHLLLWNPGFCSSFKTRGSL